MINLRQQIISIINKKTFVLKHQRKKNQLQLVDFFN
jgi:hypothetical protein